MAHVAMVDEGDYWKVIADYSGSSRHSALSPEEWQAEFEHEAYSTMKESQPGVMAAIIPVGVGNWKKDWSGPYVVPTLKLRLSSNGTPDFDGTPAVVLSEKHTVLIQAFHGEEEIDSAARLQVMVTAPIPVSSFTPVLSNGKASFQVGPCPSGCDLTVTVGDPDGGFAAKSIKLRFKGRQVEVARPPAPAAAPAQTPASAPAERVAAVREPAGRSRWWWPRRR
jgi:hypothetical protein